MSSCCRSQPAPSLCLQLTREFFTKELTKHYQGNNDTDVFSATWNSVMITVSGPRDAVRIPSPDARCSQCLASRARLVHVSAETSVINQALLHPAQTGPRNPHSHSMLAAIAHPSESRLRRKPVCSPCLESSSNRNGHR